MIEADKKVFFNMKKGEPNTARVGGKFSFNSLPVQIQDTIKKKLAKKDDVMARGLSGEIPGLKINGKQVTRENIKDFEITTNNIPKEIKKVKTSEKVEVEYIKEDLMKLTFSKLKKIANKLGETGRSKNGLIKDILKHN